MNTVIPYEPRIEHDGTIPVFSYFFRTPRRCAECNCSFHWCLYSIHADKYCHRITNWHGPDVGCVLWVLPNWYFPRYCYFAWPPAVVYRRGGANGAAGSSQVEDEDGWTPAPSGWEIAPAAAARAEAAAWEQPPSQWRAVGTHWLETAGGLTAVSTIIYKDEENGKFYNSNGEWCDNLGRLRKPRGSPGKQATARYWARKQWQR